MTSVEDRSSPPNGQPVLTGLPLPRRLVRQGRRLATGPGSAWDLAPRGEDLHDLQAYRRSTGLFRTLKRSGHTMISARRARALTRAAAAVDREGVPGALVDCGVWNGGSTILLGATAPDRRVWAFDSFEGLPAPGSLDGESSHAHTGDCLGSEDMLRAGFRNHVPTGDLEVRRGWFDQTFPQAVEEIGPIAVLHADGDWYESVRDTLAAFGPLVSPGGFVVIDDYGHWIGARRATDEHRASTSESGPLRRSDYSGRWWRRAS